MANANQNDRGDWAWPRLIDSLQRDIELLRQNVAESREESKAQAEAHRRQVDELIAQLREVQSDIRPIVEREKRSDEARQKLRTAWLEKAGWAVLVLLGVAVWEYLKGRLR